jgi:hypothetical protein
MGQKATRANGTFSKKISLPLQTHLTNNLTRVSAMRQILVFLLALMIIAGCSVKESFNLKGHVEDAPGEQLFLYRMDLDAEVLLDSTVIKSNGTFKFKQPRLSEPSFLKLSLTPSKFITLLADSTETIEISTNKDSFASGYSVRNSIGSKHIQLLNQNIIALRKQVDSLMTLYNSLPDEEKAGKLEPISNEIIRHIDKYKAGVGSFVMDNPRSFASYYALLLTLSDESMVMNVLDKQDQVYFSTIATSLNLLYPESQRVRQLYDIVLSAKTEQRRAQILDFINNSEGSPSPEISAPDLSGANIALSSLRGKVVLLSFSASWDQASVNENKKLLPTYSRYSSKGFEVYQVCLERSRVLWENSLIQQGIPWISVSELQYTNSYAARIYNVQKIPANYLLDREGNIVGKDLFGSLLEEKLKEIL